MLDPIRWLFDAGGFVTRDHCGPWNPTLKWVYIVSNAAIAMSYFVMPAMIAILWVRRRKDMVYPWILVLFTSFIFGCGLTHVADVLAFYWPAYHLFTGIAAGTALVSGLTASLLWIEIGYLLGVPTPKQWRDAQDKMAASLAYEQDMSRRLRTQVVRYQEMQRLGLWERDSDLVISELRTLLYLKPKVEEVAP